VELSIILVNYNGIAYLPGCLDSIKKFSPPLSEVILVDNGSQDGSAEVIRRDYPWVRLLRSERNLGFSRGNNLGAAQASGRFLLLLNTDTLLLEPVAPAMQWLDENQGFGILSIGMIDGEGVLRACTGHFPSPTRLALFRRMLIAPDRYKGDEACEVDWVQGSFLLIRKNLWQELNGLDDRYFMYVEDVDLCKRALERGEKCAFLPQMQYKHFGGFSPLRFPIQVANLSLYVDQHMTALPRIVSKAVLLLGCIGRVVWYGILAFSARDEQSRIMELACRQALRNLLFHADLVGVGDFGVRP
jgi:GT2 family glycosyltransferase